MWSLNVFLVALLLIQITGKPQWHPNECFYSNCYMPQEPYIPIRPPVQRIPYTRQIYMDPVPMQVKPIDAFHLYIHNQHPYQGFVPTIPSTPNVNLTSTISTNATTETPTREAYLCPDVRVSPCRNRRQISSAPPVVCITNNDCSNITTTEMILCCLDPCLDHFVCKTADKKLI